MSSPVVPTFSIKESKSHRQNLVPVFVVLFLFLSFIAGLVASTGSPLIIMLFTAMFLGVFFIAKPLILLILVLFGGLVLSGSVSLYYPPLSQLRWGVVIAALLLCLVSLLAKFFRSSSSAIEKADIYLHPIFIWAVLFFSVVLFSSFFNLGLTLDAVIGLKGYFQVWGLLLAFAWLGFGDVSMKMYAWAILALTLLQVPFALHQFLVLVPQRTTIAAAQDLVVAPDIVVGTFVGSMGGGGGNVILSSLQVIGLALLAVLGRRGLLSRPKILVLAMLFITPVLLNETKATFVLLPLALLWIYRNKIRSNPIQTIFGGIAVIFLLWGLLYAYVNLPRSQSQTFKSPEQYIEKAISYNFSDRGYGRFKLNRTTVYTHWLEHHGISDIVHTLVGHGAGETNEGGVGLRKNSIAMSQFQGMGIGLTALSALLWETGVLGLVSAVGLFFSVFRAACNIEHAIVDPYAWAVLKAMQAGILVMGLNLLHNNYFVFEIGFQTLLFLIFGTVILLARRHARHQINAI